MTVIGGVSWLSSSSAEIARARNVLKALTPGGVIDELGFLVLQGAFAEQFYPAVTTPMTRARYLIFVPAIYQYLERSGKAVGKDVDRLSRDLQFDLLQSVREEDGAIGKESGRQIVRPPSEIYWNALAVLGLATQRVSEASYQRACRAGRSDRRCCRTTTRWRIRTTRSPSGTRRSACPTSYPTVGSPAIIRSVFAPPRHVSSGRATGP